jgi:hypothetical protein
MPSGERRVPFSLRISAQAKAQFSAATERCGIDPSTAARQLLELVVQRLDAGGDFIDALHELKEVWGVPRKSEIELRLESLTRALASFSPPEDHAVLVNKIEAVERELQAAQDKRDKKRRA